MILFYFIHCKDKTWIGTNCNLNKNKFFEFSNKNSTKDEIKFILKLLIFLSLIPNKEQNRNCVESKDKFQQLNEKLNCQNEQTVFTLFYLPCI